MSRRYFSPSLLPSPWSGGLTRRRVARTPRRPVSPAGALLLCSGFLVTLGSAFGQVPAVNLEPSNVSKIVLYDHLFHHIEFLEERAAEVEASGLDARHLREHYLRRAGLTAGEHAALKQVALDSNTGVAAQDRQALAIIAAARARYPDGRVPIGESVSEPPRELFEMQQARDRMRQTAIDRLRARLGAERFAHFDAFVEENIGSRVSWTPVVVTPPQP